MRYLLLSDAMRNWLRLKKYSLATPLLLAIRPQIKVSSPEKVEILIPLSWMNRNSWNTMFFAAIAAGADITGGWAAFEPAQEYNVGVLFKV